MFIYFGIGTNLGNREANIREALRFLDNLIGKQMACSSIYRSAPQGVKSDNEFANIVVVYETAYSPEEVLLITQQIECDMGRTHKSVNGIYHDRIIDIDLLQAYTIVDGELSMITCQQSNLALPHPRIYERDFVFIPLREVENREYW